MIDTRIDMTGQRYGRLLVTSYVGLIKGETAWNCICDCGNVKVTNRKALIRGQVKSCGCLGVGHRLADFAGTRIGNFTVLERGTNLKRNTRWWCQCDCGNKVQIITNKLRSKKGIVHWCRECSNKSRRFLTPDEILYRNKKGGAIKRDKQWSLTLEQFTELSKKDCHYCGLPPSQKFKAYTKVWITYQGIDRKNSDIGYEYNNCVPCCGYCNSMKLQLSYDDFLDRISHIYLKHCTDRVPGILTFHKSPGTLYE